ncbi:MAG: DegT/DnrJ/EryC1/StrS family aminotransferase, partial [Snowella sp.]|nr:DegT/DnrJ/EryC1/StrS family aminotransferase [Snowella sp.]
MKLLGQVIKLSEDKNNPKNEFALVLSEVDSEGEISLVKITNNPNYPNLFEVTSKDLAEGIHEKTVYIRTDRLLTVPLNTIVEQGIQLKTETLAEVHRAIILQNTRQFSHLKHLQNRPAIDPLRPAFFGGSVPYAGRVFTSEEVEAAISTTLDFWLTLGVEGAAFEKELAAFLGVHYCLAVNSGSSANLIALSTLTSPLIEESRRLKKGDEVITCAAGFPTTVSPIIQNGCIPVFIDNDPVT